MSRLFSGKEVEGEFKGLKTLFVAGDVPIREIAYELMSGDYQQVYFGADSLSYVNWDTVATILTSKKILMQVVIEVSSPVPAALVKSDKLYVVLNVQQDVKKLQAIINSIDAMQESHIQVKFDTAEKTYIWKLGRVGMMINERKEIIDDIELWKSDDPTSKS